MALLLICLAFVLGSFPSGVVLGRLLGGRDVRRYGSGNIGAANVAREMGFKVGIPVALADVFKGLIAIWLAQGAGMGHMTLALVALAAVLGHDFSLFLRFRGGKGVATTLGVALALITVPTVAAVAVWVALLLISRMASLASLLSLALLPILAGVSGAPPVYVELTTALFLLAVFKHWANIVRLLAGRERRFQLRRASNG